LHLPLWCTNTSPALPRHFSNWSNCRSYVYHFSQEYHKMKTCLHDVMFKQCLDSIAQQIPWLKNKMEDIFDMYLSSISSMESATCHQNVTFNVSSITDPNIKRIMPCNQALFDEVPFCSVELVATFNVNRTNPKLCG